MGVGDPHVSDIEDGSLGLHSRFLLPVPVTSSPCPLLRSAMNAQASATSYDIKINSLQKDAALGTYRIRLENVELPVIPQDRQKNVDRLKRIFKTQECLRLDPQNYVSATIDAEVFHRRVQRAERQDSDPSLSPPELLLALGEEVRCIHGKCRIKAADSILKGRHRWWTVSLYKTEIGMLQQFSSLFPFLRY